MTHGASAGEARSALAGLAAELADPDGRLRLEPETAGQDVARLVLALAEFLRQLMELQAIRRMEAGALSPDEEERLGHTLMEAERAIREVAAGFGLGEADLSLDLGVLGRTV